MTTRDAGKDKDNSSSGGSSVGSRKPWNPLSSPSSPSPTLLSDVAGEPTSGWEQYAVTPFHNVVHALPLPAAHAVDGDYTVLLNARVLEDRGHTIHIALGHDDEVRRFAEKSMLLVVVCFH